MKLQMTHWLRLLAVTLTLALSLGVRAHAAGNTYTPETVPNVFAQDSLQLLTDPGDHIDEASQARINELLLQLRLSTGVEFAVVVLDDIEGDIESFSTQLFRLWGIGSKTRNDGLLATSSPLTSVRCASRSMGSYPYSPLGLCAYSEV